MREMSTHLGATGDDGGAEGLSEVQESVLEHSKAEDQETVSEQREGREFCFQA